MQLLMVCLLVGVTMSALVYASALQQCYQKLLDMSKRKTTDIFFWSMLLLSNSSVKWSSADSVEWSFLFPLCRWCMTLFESRKLVNCEWAALAHTLDKIGSKNIGLVFAGSSLSPDLRIGTICAFFPPPHYLRLWIMPPLIWRSGPTTDKPPYASWWIS